MKRFTYKNVVKAGEVFAVRVESGTGKMAFIIEDGERVAVPKDITARAECGQPVGMMLIDCDNDYFYLIPKDIFEAGFVEVKVMEDWERKVRTGVGGVGGGLKRE
jgi:hypothetical protein